MSKKIIWIEDPTFGTIKYAGWVDIKTKIIYPAKGSLMVWIEAFKEKREIITEDNTSIGYVDHISVGKDSNEIASLSTAGFDGQFFFRSVP